MGWASGSNLFDRVMGAAQEAIPDNDTRKRFYLRVVEAFEAHDCDTLDECFGSDPVFDEIITDRYPEEDEEV